MPSSALRICPLCEATCGLTLTIDDGRVTGARGDRDDVFSHGFICPKGSTLRQLHEDPDWLRGPLVKRDGRFEPASWDEALALVGAKLKAAKLPYYTESVATAKGPVTRVRAGPFASRSAAEKAHQQLRSLGFSPGNVGSRP